MIAASALVAGGLAVGFAVPEARALKHRLSHVPPLGDPGWISIQPDGSITIFSTLTEMGQGIWTALAQIVAEELEADLRTVSVEMAPAWRAYTTPIGFYTGGSSSVQRLFANMRSIAAAARVMLIETAADRWKVAADDCSAMNGQVSHPSSQRRASFGDLAKAAAHRTPPASAPLKSRSQWKLIGKSQPRLDVPSKVNGAAQFGIDLKLPGMLIAAVSQSPSPGAHVVKLNRDAALRTKGVLRVIELDSTIAVVAQSYWIAAQGLKNAEVQWSAASQPIDTTQLQNALRETLEAGAPASKSESASPDREIRALYEAPLLMHAQLEPLNATAKVDLLSAEIWAPTQMQSFMQSEIAKALHLWAHAVTVHTPLVGGGFGRRLEVDYGVTAARIAREFDVPVKVIWSREEDCTQGRFRPMSSALMRATLSGDGSPQRLDSHVASIGEQPRTGALRQIPYAIADCSTRYTGVTSAVRIGSWRSVDSSQNIFFRECFIDECAHAAGVDPLAYRQKLLSHNARALRVLETASTVSAWNSSNTGEARYLGMAFCEGFGSFCAQVVEVVRTSTQAFLVAKIFIVVDCGIAIDPGNIRAQLQGAALFGLSAALREEVTYLDGQLQQRNFDQYPLLRIAETPEIIVEIIETADVDIGGMGEVGVPPVAPALVNALFAATGTRIRELPLTHAKLQWALKG